MPSLNLREQPHYGSKWLEQTNEMEILINLTLSMISPDLFQMGLSLLEKLRNSESTNSIARIWQSAYTGVAIISNRRTKSHRDNKGRPEWYDTLVSYAGAGAQPSLSTKDLGLELEYGDGTVVALCGTILEHEVSSWGDGDRVCYAHFMRESGRKRLGVPPAGWVYRNTYLTS